MSGKEKIEKLTRGWYGYAVFSALVSVLTNGIGVFSIIAAAFGALLSIVIAYALGRWLLSRSSFARFALLVLSGIGTIAGAYGTGKMALGLFDSFSLAALGTIGMTSIAVFMNFRTARTLLDKDVKAFGNG